jgi:hypothetical protein
VHFHVEKMFHEVCKITLEGKRDRDRQTDRQAGRKTERQTDRQTDR